MPATVGVTYLETLTAVHTVTGTFISSSDPTVTTALSGESLTLTASTTPPVTKVASGTATMTAGAVTLDLTALSGLTADETISFSGLKVQFAFFRSPSTNANVLTVGKGASNGYGLSAAGGAWSVALDPDSSVLRRIEDTAPDVAGGAKTIDIAGTGSQTVEYILIAG
jgi:hypothetical protein